MHLPYSHRTDRWGRHLREPGQWRRSGLREARRDGDGDGEPEWERVDALHQGLALALHKAVHGSALRGHVPPPVIEMFEPRRSLGPTTLRLAAGVAGRKIHDEDTTRASRAEALGAWVRDIIWRGRSSAQ